ncbi:NAD(P)-binding protein [Amniculicola lignicola CBS 123094]|uniref:NAD(P)-binding protein n=1 Tax=Amniculicola lignicola CBS 123094 TaxID=1392246 RepID=A0A6A5W886_9PLEO|nr:NAD(P)-binding protein [Amniculicola lignicola CBS 123094]
MPLSEGQLASLLPFVKCLLVLFLLREANAALSRWAERNWMWKRDHNAWLSANELAVVTGGSNGIGAAVVKRLVSHGITVAVLDVQPLSDEFQKVRKVGDALRSGHGPPSILINNAGIGNASNILDIAPASLRLAFEVNLLSHWNTVQEFLPDMLAKKKGHIMGVASFAAFFGLAGMVDYSCTKAGLTAFYEGLTQELKHRYGCPQVKTSLVYPSWTKTRLITAIEKGIRKSRAPVMEPNDVAEAMVNQIVAARSGHIYLGPSILASLRALPTWLQEFVRDRLAQIVTVNASTAVARDGECTAR